ncbi:MAG: PIN domain-containing protein [Verrucomicrobia bacterium]|nr:PIN domain-containing protein [Verrucomicrobiota bacterium]
MVVLLDVNVLIALGDPFHTHHERVQEWFHHERARPWATCPITENGFLRILGHPNYKDSPGSPAELQEVLRVICSAPGHQFWSDAISFRDEKKYPQLPGSKQLTDFYLLALAIHHKGKLATLDRRIDASVIPGGEKAYLVIP